MRAGPVLCLLDRYRCSKIVEDSEDITQEWFGAKKPQTYIATHSIAGTIKDTAAFR